MRKKVLLLALTSMLMSLCVPMGAQQVLPKGSTKEEVMRKFPGLVIDDEGNATMNGEPVSKLSLDYSVKVQPSEPSKPDTGIHILDSRTNDDKTVALTQLPADMIGKIKAYDKESNPRVMTVYGPPFENGEEENVPDLKPSKRALRKARKAGK